MAFFATEYTVHFDDTMAYGGHHFLTGFKFQCAARETFMFGEHIFDVDGVKETLAGIHLLTSDAYSRNLNPTQLGDRVAILLTLEDWGRVSARFCYRVIDTQGRRICAGFQTLICADAKTGQPMPLPSALRSAMDAVREIEELPGQKADSFRNCVLEGGGKLDAIFGQAEQQTALAFLSKRYPAPQVVESISGDPLTVQTLPATNTATAQTVEQSETPSKQATQREAWFFAGQGAFDASLFCQRILAYSNSGSPARAELQKCFVAVQEMIDGDAQALFSGDAQRVLAAVNQVPDLMQVAIHLQNVLGGLLRGQSGRRSEVLVGHSFGEIAAMGVGECFDLPTGVRIVCMRTRAIKEHAVPGGGLLVVASTRHHVETEAALLGLDRVRVAGRNHSRQTVATGPVEQLNRLQQYFQSTGVGSTNIPSPTSFHHPELQAAAAHWLQQMLGLVFQPPKQPIYSPIGRRYIEFGDDIAAVLASQLIRPFDLQGAVTDLVESEIDQLVDCGSTGSLGRLISKACEDAVPVSVSDTPSADAGSQPPHAVAAKVAAKIGHLETQDGQSQLSAQSASQSVTQPFADPNASPPPTLPGIAIVSQGCILPGGATSPEQLFSAIEEQRLGIVDQRDFDPQWSEDFYSEKLIADRSTSHLAGRVNDGDIVVPVGVDPAVFAGFSRTQRLLCIALAPCVGSLADANRVMCLIGATADGFEDQDEVWSLRFAGIDPTDQEVDQRMNTIRSAFATPHEAVQEVFDKIVRPGLEVTLVDAACASSLYTMTLGMHALETDKADAVIAGGVFCPGPGNSCLFSQFHGTTATGCRPFDAGADGVVFSEGAALVTLRRPADAKRLGLTIQATVRGAGLSSDGRSPSANVPQSNGQIISLQRCYENYGIDPATIQAIEGHGTSTSVGDSTELKTLRQYFAQHVVQPIPVHSLKGALGHAGWAAGTASVIAACEYLRRGQFPAQAFHREPSSTLQECGDTLTVPTQPVQLPSRRRRIAIDGFGFGGANAHIVMEDPSLSAATESVSSDRQPVGNKPDQELVIVSFHQENPTVASASGLLFDRESTTLPAGCLVLPELVDDMDLSQTLAVVLTKQVIDKLPGFDNDLRRDTSLVLAMCGKTERGIEATARIMTNRLRRNLSGIEHLQDALATVQDRSRPSGSYTLQCMMPNVATGRAALLMNLNGPNFVVDAGQNSLTAAMESAALLLRSGENGGARVAIVAAINAKSLNDPNVIQPSGDPAFAAAFAVTTRQFAQSQGWNVITNADDAISNLDQGASLNGQLQSLLDSIGTPVTKKPAIKTSAPADTPSRGDNAFVESECKIHSPVWVEKAAANNPNIAPTSVRSMLAVAPANTELVAELLAVLPEYASRFLIAVVGEDAANVNSRFNDPRVVPVDLTDESSAASTLDRIKKLEAQAIVAFDAITSWDLIDSLGEVSSNNRLCELMFLVAKQNIKRIEQNEVELWSVFVDAFDAENKTVHARSGAVIGLLKSIRREHPALRSGSICTQGIGLSATIDNLFNERDQAEVESEIAYTKDVRYVRRLQATTNRSNPIPQVILNSDSVVVATGGARGVTSVMLDAIAREHQCTVIAFGRSQLEAGPQDPDDPTVQQQFYRQFLADNPGASAKDMNRSFDSTRARWEAHRTIETLKAAGGRVQYMAVDVTDQESVTRALQQIHSQHGKVDLLIHGAGVQLSKRLEDRTLSEFRRTFGVKVSGLGNLVSSWKQLTGKTLNAHVLTSAYSVFGNDGQHDYGAANETMDRLCGISRVGNAHRWSSIAWLAWDGVGMTRGSEYRALAKQRGLSGVTPETGKQLFRQVLSGQTGAAINVPVSNAEHVKYQIKTVPAQASLSSRTIEVDVDLSQIDCLPFHKVRDTPTLPGAWILERLVHGGLQLQDDADRINNVIVHDVTFKRFVRFANNQNPNVRVVAEKTPTAIDVSMLIDVIHSSGHVLDKDVVCATASLVFDSDSESPGCLVETPGPSSRSVDDPYCHGDSGEVDLSGPFNCLSAIAIGATTRRATFQPKVACDWVCEMPALLLDAAWRVAAVYAVSWENDLFVPVHIRRMVIPIGRDIDARKTTGWQVLSTTPAPDGRDVRWDRTEVIDDQGRVRLVVENGFAKSLA